MEIERMILLSGIVMGGLFGADLRLGVIGTDTSHVTAFAAALNDSNAKEHVNGARIVVAYKGGSPDVEQSYSRVNRFADELRTKFRVRFVDHIPEMCDAVDGVLLESLDGRVHLAQMREAIQCGKPVFIDKPLASSLNDAREIARLAGAAHVPWFSASAMRFGHIESLKKGAINGAIVWGPGPTEPHQQLELSFYGIHAVEMLYTLMGPGCSQVARISGKDADIVTCNWKDGRLGTIRLDRPYSKYGAVVFQPNNKVDAKLDLEGNYVPLVREIVRFMTTRTPPVPNTETLEIIEFLDAAQRSEKSGGAPAPI